MLDIQRIIEFQKSFKAFPDLSFEIFDDTIAALEELEQYRQIGTVDECRAAREKEKRKESKLNESSEYVCPVCRRPVTKYFAL